MATVLVACKVTEHNRKWRHVVNAFDAISNPGDEFRPMPLFGERYYASKKRLVDAEFRLLTELGFQVDVQLPHVVMLCYLNHLKLTKETDVCTLAWSYLNDS